MDTDNSQTDVQQPAPRSLRLPIRLSVLCFVGVLVAGSTALGFYYYYVYSPPLMAADIFMNAMEATDREVLAGNILVRVGRDTDDLRVPTEDEIDQLLRKPFERGRILDQRRREGSERSYHYLVYREPDGQVYALLVTEFEDQYHIVIPDSPMSERELYLWDYIWTN